MKIILVIFSILTFSKTYALIIDCVFDMIDWAYVENRVYSCDGRTIERGTEGNIEKISGSHMGGKTNNDVEGFNFEKQDISLIPKNTADVFPNLKCLNFFESNLLTISATDLQPFPELLVFAVMSNKIVSVDGDLFTHNLKLRYIDFDLNQLENVGHNLLGHLNQLKIADFNRNPCIKRLASTSAQIQELNILLPIHCPPLAPTTTKPAPTTTTKSPEICSLRCTLNDEVSELKRSNFDLQERLDEVEKKLREVIGSPNWRK